DGAQDSSVSRRYPAASRSEPSSAGSAISTTNIHPSPYGSEFTSSGVSASAGLVSTTRPDTGEQTSETDFVDSTSPQLCAAATVGRGSGSCTNTTSPSASCA